jgi:hypothetical protein
MKRRPARMGRPPEFRHRVRLIVFLERAEQAALRARARAEKVSISRLARRLLLAALGIERQP